MQFQSFYKFKIKILVANLYETSYFARSMSEHWTKRTFLTRSAAIAVGFAVTGWSMGYAFAQNALLRLRVIDLSDAQRRGMQKRLNRVRVSNPEDAFRFANRRAEIEVTR